MGECNAELLHNNVKAPKQISEKIAFGRFSCIVLLISTKCYAVFHFISEWSMIYMLFPYMMSGLHSQMIFVGASSPLIMPAHNKELPCVVFLCEFKKKVIHTFVKKKLYLYFICSIITVGRNGKK